MASPDKNSVDLPIQVFGGRVTQFDPSNLPAGASPFNQDVSFSGQNPAGTGMVGGVATRPGVLSFYTLFAGNPTVNYIKTFQDPLDNLRQLILDGAGNLHQEFPALTLSVIGKVVAASFAQSDTLDGREWLAIGDGQFGIDIPRQWDGTNYRRASQVGPGAPPSVSDENITFPISATGATMSAPVGIQAAPAGLIQDANSFVVTVQLNASFAIGPGSGPQVGDLITVSGATNASYNRASTPITAVLGPHTIQYAAAAFGLAASGGGQVQFAYATLVFNSTMTVAQNIPYGLFVKVASVTVAAYNGTWRVVAGWPTNNIQITVNIAQFGLANSGNGQATIVGNISAGVHQLSVCFVTDEFYITKPAPFSQWTAAGVNRAVCSSIPIGPPNVIQRILIATPVITAPAITGPLFYFDGSVQTPTVGTFPTMVINDNTSTTYTIDFIDAVLENATAATNLFNLLELGECSATVAYSDRMFWCGERNKLPNLLNLTFDGGFSQANGFPLGWNLDLTNSAGGAGDYANPYFGGDYAITGDGATATRGRISQSAYQDSLGVAIIQSNTSYSVRVRVAKNNTLVAGTLNIDLQTTSGSVTSIGLAITAGSLTTTYKEFIGTFPNTFAAPQADLLLRVYANGTPTNNGTFFVDCIEIFPTQVPVNLTVVRGSYAEDPESFDQLTGLFQVGVTNGQAVRSMFTLLDNKLYLVKERSLYVTQDDNQNEPNSWAVSTVSQTVGTPSVNGVGVGESWVVIASHDGVYIFWGSEPVKISQEIQPDWNTINWAAGSTIYCVVDTFNKRIHIGAPVNGSSTPNVEFVCDYSQLANSEGATSAEDIVAHPQAYYSAYQPTKVMAPGKARKWTLWNLNGGQGANCAALTIRPDGSYHLLRGNAVGNGKVYDQQATQLSDDGVAINSQYQTYFFPSIEEEQMLQLGSHRKLCKYLTGSAIGAGTMTWTMLGEQNQRIKALSSLTLQNPAKWQFEKNVNFIGERMSLSFGTNALNAWFELTQLSPTIQREMFTPVRGVA